MSSPTTASTRSLSLSAIGSILASMFCFAVVDALAKTVALQYPANEVTFFRMLFGLVPAVAMCCIGRLSWSERLANLDVKGQPYSVTSYGVRRCSRYRSWESR